MSFWIRISSTESGFSSPYSLQKSGSGACLTQRRNRFFFPHASLHIGVKLSFHPLVLPVVLPSKSMDVFPPMSVTGLATVFAPPSNPTYSSRIRYKVRHKKDNQPVSRNSPPAILFREDVCREKPCIPRVGMKLSAFSRARAFICLRKASVRQHNLPQFPYGKLLFASLCLKFPQLALQAQFPSSALINCWAVRPDTPPCRNSNWSARRSSSSSASVMPWRSASASTIS